MKRMYRGLALVLAGIMMLLPFANSGITQAAKKVGTAKITVSSKLNPKKKSTISVSVTNDVLVKSIQLNKTKITAEEYQEDEVQLKVKKVLPSKAKNKRVKWSSSNEDVAEVDEDGSVSFGDAGTATITATAADKGGAKAECKVTVKETENEDDTSDSEGDSTKGDNPSQSTATPVPTKTPSATPPTGEENLSEEDKAALKKLIAEQRANGATVSEDIHDSAEYSWQRGRLVSISWTDIGLTGRLDVSELSGLTYLDCGSNQLGELDVSKNTALTYLDCYENQLSELDVHKNTALTYLDCRRNQLSKLDVSNCPNLQYLYCDSTVMVIGYNKDE